MMGLSPPFFLLTRDPKTLSIRRVTVLLMEIFPPPQVETVGSFFSEIPSPTPPLKSVSPPFLLSLPKFTSCADFPGWASRVRFIPVPLRRAGALSRKRRFFPPLFFPPSLAFFNISNSRPFFLLSGRFPYLPQLEQKCPSLSFSFFFFFFPLLR